MLEQGNITLPSDPAPLVPVRDQLRQWLRDGYELTKPRITFLVLITTFTGMWLSARGIPSLTLIVFTLLGVGMASGSSSAFNNYIDREIDKQLVEFIKSDSSWLLKGNNTPKSLLYGTCFKIGRAHV